jgi:predicted Zn-dependent protease
MISKRNLLSFVGAFGLAACSGGAATPQGSTMPGSKPFTALVIAARSAAGTGDLPGAGRKLDEARALEPYNPALWVEIARLRYRGGEHLEALAAADKALALGPQNGPALLLRAQLVRDAHGLGASLPWYEAASTAEPANPDIWLDYAATLGDLGRNRTMLEALTKLGEIAPTERRANFLSAVLAARSGNAVLARSLLERSGMTDQDVPAALMLDALISMAQGNYISGAERLEQLSRLQPDNARARELLARALVMSGRDGEVVARFGREAKPQDASPYLAMLVGRAHERLGERDKAAPWLNRARQGAAGKRMVLPVALGLPQPTAALRSAAQTCDWSAAASAAADLRRRFPGSADIAALSGDAALGRGDAKGALEHYAAAAAVRRSWPLTRKAISAYRQLGDADAADLLLIRHVAGDPGNIDAAMMLAQRSTEWQDWGRAGMLLDHVAALGGGNDPGFREMRAATAQGIASTD